MTYLLYGMPASSGYPYNQIQSYDNSNTLEYTDSESHIHQLIGTTSKVAGHEHTYIETTEPAPDVPGHTHVYIGWTNFNDKHRHKISGRTGPAIPLSDGGHVHYYEGYTTGYPYHPNYYSKQHWYSGFTTPYYD